MAVFIGNKEYFPGIQRIAYEGLKSDKALAFKHYDENKKVAGKTMKEHLRYAVCYWHTFKGAGGDPFGPGTRQFPWALAKDPMQEAKDTLDAAFEFFTKLGV